MDTATTTLAFLTTVTAVVNVLGVTALVKHYRRETAYARHLAKGDL